MWCLEKMKCICFWKNEPNNFGKVDQQINSKVEIEINEETDTGDVSIRKAPIIDDDNELNNYQLARDNERKETRRPIRF